MNNLQPTIKEKQEKFKTTLYLTDRNRKWLNQLNRWSRTKLINQAITEKLEKSEREILKEKLLNRLDNMSPVPSNGTSTQDALHEIRTKELKYLISKH